MWHLQTNHHGTRDNDPSSPSISHLRITFAGVLDSAERHLKSFVRPTDPPFATPRVDKLVDLNAQQRQLDRWADEGGAITPVRHRGS